jgi:hemerythrin-like domain-containing protein
MNTATRHAPSNQLLHSPGHGFHEPFDMLLACHDRLLRMLGLLERLQGYLDTEGCDRSARDAARDLLRYFDTAMPAHHEDEERHVLPQLVAAGLQELAGRLRDDHRNLTEAWSRARRLLVDVAEGRWNDALQQQAAAEWPQLQRLYGPHVDLENSIAFGVARSRMDAAEREAMGREMALRRGVRDPG